MRPAHQFASRLLAIAHAGWPPRCSIGEMMLVGPRRPRLTVSIRCPFQGMRCLELVPPCRSAGTSTLPWEDALSKIGHLPLRKAVAFSHCITLSLRVRGSSTSPAMRGPPRSILSHLSSTWTSSVGRHNSAETAADFAGPAGLELPFPYLSAINCATRSAHLICGVPPLES
jgi:hypothetical protein